MRTAYLEFNEPDDYIAHVKAQGKTETCLEIVGETGKSNKHGIAPVSFFAVATQRFTDHIAVCRIAICHTTTVNLELDKHNPPEKQARVKIHENFDKVKAMYQERGLQVQAGKWTIERPTYFR